MRPPFTFRLAGVCPAGHETELFAARIDPADNSTLASAEAAIPAAGVVGRCATCGGRVEAVRTQVDGETVEEVSAVEFERRAAGKAPPRNYG